MSINLPPIKESPVPELLHFPTRMHAAIFRLWETVKKERIAFALDLPLATVEKAASDMGLAEQQHMEDWSSRGYITTLRNIWHILPYSQILKLIDMDEETLAIKLQEEDSIGLKLGGFKPACEPVREEALAPDQEAQLANIKNIMETDCAGMFTGAQPFSFFSEDSSVPKQGVVSSDGLRLIYSYCALYSTLENDISLSFPDALMKQYQNQGINAIWLEARLYRMTPFPYDESYSIGWELRQQRLRELVALAEKYDIKVYLYLNEPHALPPAFFEKYPQFKGRIASNTQTCLCTNAPGVLDYIQDAVKNLCASAPGLGGLFLITQSESNTHCKSRDSVVEPCPRCADSSIPDLISDLIWAIYKGAKSADENLKIISWAWGWDGYMTKEECLEIIDRIPSDIILQSNSEAQMVINKGGIESSIKDYSMSNPGPSQWAKDLWARARKRGMEVCAKVQLNNTWECSTATYLPVFDLIREHMIGLRNSEVQHLMMSWTLGGYPSINLKIASQCLDNPDEALYDKLLAEEYGGYAPVVKKATNLFSQAFREFPFHITTAYVGPQNAGPSNLLYEKPSGLKATMTCYPYDDLEFWNSVYPSDIFRNQFKKVSEMWKKGLDLLEEMPDCELKHMAWTGYALFRSSYLQIDFIMKRETGDTSLLKPLVEEEREIALTTYQVMRRNSTIGFEAANHYFFNKGMLAEKVIQCDDILRRWK